MSGRRIRIRIPYNGNRWNFVPFKVVSSRRRGTDAQLLTIDGIDNDEEAALYSGKTYTASQPLSTDWTRMHIAKTKTALLPTNSPDSP